MMKLQDILIKVDEYCPNVKGSEKLYIVGLVMDAYQDGYKDATNNAKDIIQGIENETDDF